MTTQPLEGVIRPIEDPIYTATAGPVPIDKDTLYRLSSYENAVSDGTGQLTVAGCLNSATGKKTRFVINNDAAAKYRWGTMGLAIEMYFTDLDDPTAACPVVGTNAHGHVFNRPANCPSWNLTGALISGITLRFQGTEVYKAHEGRYLEEFTARLLRKYSYNALNERADMLFTPVGSKRYTVQSYGAAETYVLNAAEATVCTVTPEDLGHLSAPYAEIQVAAQIAADSTFIGYNPISNPFACDEALQERSRNWCQGNTHQRKITKIIPFNDLFPSLPDSVMKNLRTIEIEISWTNTQDLLEHFSDDEDTHGGVFVTRCYVVTDAYYMSTLQKDEVAINKRKGELDVIPMISTRVFKQAYIPGSDIVIPNIVNFDSIMIMQPARGFVNRAATGVAANDVRRLAYTSFGEFLLFGNSSDATASVAPDTGGQIKLRADDPYAAANCAPINSVQISVGKQRYPSRPITVSHTEGGVTCLDATLLYEEYLKAVSRVGRRDTAPAIPYDIFKSTMPFIYLRPFADDAPRITPEGRDIVVSMTGGQAAGIGKENIIVIVIFEYKLLTIRPDGVCEMVA